MCSHIYEAFAAIFLYRHHLVEAANSFMLYFISFCKHTILFGATLIFSKGQVFFLIIFVCDTFCWFVV